VLESLIVFFKEFEMEIARTNDHEITVSSNVTASSFVSEWRKIGQLTFDESDGNGVRQKFTVTMPLEVARSLCEELAGDIIKYDEQQAAAEAEAEAERLAEAKAEAEAGRLAEATE
jgi:hypothetical protein